MLAVSYLVGSGAEAGWPGSFLCAGHQQLSGCVLRQVWDCRYSKHNHPQDFMLNGVVLVLY